VTSYDRIKRVFDVAVSVIAVTVLSPVLVLIAVRIVATDGLPVLYRGRRTGKDGKPFEMLKFRTMVKNADVIGGSSTGDDDQRITKVGRVLRRYKLDELPQLFNVIGGTMSLVGPRPQVAWAVELYSVEDRRVLTVLPGITDYASVRFPDEGRILRGSKDPDADYMRLIHPEKMRLSREYVDQRSFRTDVKVIFQTLAAMAHSSHEAGPDEPNVTPEASS
jgi:lipopolysaccharide/colanic/teichoic acid biosynthesis glycosyltransferase